MRVTEPRHELTLGSLVLSGGIGDGWQIDALSEGATLGGGPQPLIVAIKSLLQDGSLVQKVGDDNRTAGFQLEVSADDSASLAVAEAALVAEVGVRNTLTWTPPDGWGPPTVFDVVMSSLSHNFDDMDELLLKRIYVLTLTCAPFGRSMDIVEAVAVVSSSSSPVIVTLDECDATTGWTTNKPPVTVVSSAVQAEAPEGLIWLEKTFGAAETMAPTNSYLTVTVRTFDSPHVTGTTLTYTVFADGVELPLYGKMTGLAGFEKYVYTVTAATVTVVRVQARWVKPGPPGAPFPSYTLQVGRLEKSNLPPVSGTNRQQTAVVEIGGSTRTVGSLAVEHDTTALGDCLLYTWPAGDNGFTPPLREHLNGTLSGAVTAAGSTYSGGTNNLDATVTFDVPANRLASGGYLLSCRAKGSVASWTINWTAQAVLGGTLVGPALSGSYAGTGTDYEIHTIANIVLPTLAMDPASNGVIRITMVSSAPASNDITLDEAWLFNMDLGSLTIVKCGTAAPATGGSSNRLWIDQATVNQPLPQIWEGTLDDRSDSRAASDVVAWGTHSCAPPLINVFVASNAAGPQVSFAHFRRWHTHAAS